jgi:hypothetical protein
VDGARRDERDVVRSSCENLSVLLIIDPLVIKEFERAPHSMLFEAR